MNIGITGSIACGKSTVSAYLKNKGYIVLDADKIGHEVLASDKVKERLVLMFSSDILDDNGEISREKLGKLVFGNKENLNLLNSIVHPEIRNEVLRQYKKNKDKEFVFLDVALLFEAKFTDLVEKIIVVHVTPDIQLKRLMDRNNFTKEAALNRINSQMSSEEKAKLGDYIIDNSLDLMTTYKQIDQLLEKLEKGDF